MASSWPNTTVNSMPKSPVLLEKRTLEGRLLEYVVSQAGLLSAEFSVGSCTRFQLGSPPIAACIPPAEDGMITQNTGQLHDRASSVTIQVRTRDKRICLGTCSWFPAVNSGLYFKTPGHYKHTWPKQLPASNKLSVKCRDQDHFQWNVFCEKIKNILIIGNNVKMPLYVFFFQSRLQ